MGYLKNFDDKFMKNIKTKVIKWLTTAEMLSIPRRYAGRIAMHLTGSNRIHSFYSNPSNAHALSIIKRVKKETEMLLNDFEAFQIYMAVIKTEKIEGDIAEVGVYKGGSAKLMCETAKNKSIHLFDTFEGLPDVGESDSHGQFKKGEYVAPLSYVKNCLKHYKNVYFYKGFFPATSDPVKNKKFSFIHLDVDIYESTLSSLTFFYPRMSRGGVIISHDYPGSKGVKKAFDEFFKDKPEIIIELPLCDQCLVVKLSL